jgi:ABC-type multidrug transport system fused ATPase/permease subunit
VLALTPDHLDPAEPAEPPPSGAELADARTGLRIRPGLMTALVSDQPDEAAALADRLGLCAPEIDEDVTLGGVPLTRMRRADVRRRIVVSDTGATLFSGRLGTVLDTTGGDVPRALETASTDDILEALPDGLDSVVAERGRTFSGGQRQRLVLARALAGDPEILVLVEPTSAVDAHTEARIAARLHGHREGRTTVVVTSSPLVLDAVDEVAFLRGGRVVATGTHRDLLENDAGYRAVVTREQEPAGVVS